MTAASRMSAREGTFLGLLIVGIVVPYTHFVAWLTTAGLDIPRFVDELFVNHISSFFGWDVLISVATLLVLAVVDRELSTRDRAIVIGSSILGASVGLPMYLWLRERNRRRGPAVSAVGGSDSYRESAAER